MINKITEETPCSTLYDQLPKHLANNFERHVELQNILLTIDENNFEEKVGLLLDSDFYHDITMYEMFIIISLNICFIWPKKIKIITQLFASFHKKDEERNTLGNKKQIIADRVFHGYFNNPRDDVYTFYLYILLYGVQYQDVKRSELVNCIKRNYEKKRQFKNQLCMIFLYFAPEIEAEDNDFYNEMKNYAEECREKNLLCPKTLKFLENFENYREDNWKMLINNRINFDCNDPLLRSLMSDDLELFKKTLDLDNVSQEDKKKILNEYFDNPTLSLFTIFDVKYPLILVAAGFGSKNIFTYLYENGAELDKKAENGATIVQLASMNPDEQVISILQKENFDISEGMASFVRCFNINKTKKFCPLFLGRSYEDICKNHDKEPYSFKYVMSPTKSTVLVQSVLITNFIALKMCLENKLIDINEPDGYDLTPLDISCQMGNKLIVEILVELGADLNLGSPLVNAALCGHSEIIKYLLGILHDDEDEDDNKRRNIVVHSDDQVFQITHHDCYNPNVVIPEDFVNKADSKGMTPLYASITNSHYKVTRMLLLYKKTDLNRRFKDGSTYINLAASQNNTDILGIVLEYVNIPFDEHEVSPLASAIVSGMIDSMKYLLENKRDQIDLNKMVKSSNVSALWLAVNFQRANIVKYLIEKENCKVTAVEIDLATRKNDNVILGILNKYYNNNEDNNENDDEYEEESVTEANADDFQNHDKKPDLI